VKSIRSSFRAAALAVFVAFFTAPLPAEEAKVSRLFRIPPDFFAYHLEKLAPADPPADPFAAPTGSEAVPKARPLARWPRYPHIVNSLGAAPPIDARPLLESYGISFGEGDIALAPGNVHKCNILFVKNRPEQMDLVQTIMDQLGYDGGVGPSHFEVTWRVQETNVGGKVKELLERTLFCRNGQITKFQRHREGKLMETEEFEPTLLEDGQARVNSALEFDFMNLSVKATGLVTVNPGDKKPVIIYSSKGRVPHSKLEVLMSVRRVRGLPGEGRVPATEEASRKLAAVIDAEVTAAEQTPPANRLSPEIVSLQLWSNDYEKEPRIEVHLPDGSAAGFADARTTLLALGMPLADDERAWYWPQGRMLFIHAGDKTLSDLQGLVSQQELPGTDDSYEVKIAPVETKRERERTRPVRTLLINAGQRAKGTTEIQKDRPEVTEAELSVNETRTVADVNLALENLSFGKETWTFSGQALAAADGTLPVTLVSGRAADSGGSTRSLQLTVARRGDYWRDLLNEPVQKAALLGVVASTLLPAGERK